MFGKYFQNQGMRDATIKYDGSLYTTFDGIKTSLCLGYHATFYGSVADVATALSGRHLCDKITLFIKNTFDVGEHQQPGGTDSGSDCAGGSIRIDVLRDAFGAGTQRGDDRDNVGRGELFQYAGIDRNRVADKA